MKTARDFHGHIVLFAIAVLTAATASARTVYDAGKAFNEAGHNTNSFGAWSFLHASGDTLASTAAFDATTGGTGTLVGIGGNASPWIRVNAGSDSQVSYGEEILPGELYLHPANPSTSNPYNVIRFTAQEEGWYSANVFAHDVNKESTGSAGSGVEVSVRAAGNILISKQRVSLEDYAANNPTHRFDLQMPVRHLNAGEFIEVVVGPGSAHTSDATGLRFTVTKEDEGAFYDSGIAMTNCVANTATYINPYGTIKDGTWYFLKTTVPSSSVDFVSWAPENFSHGSGSRISENVTRSSGLKGFGNNASGESPYVVVNSAASVSSDNTAPCELQAHPYGKDAKVWTTIRFRPPVSGYFSGSVVARDVNKGEDSNANGVDVYLLISERVVTNAYISAETFSATARLTFDVRLLAAGEPVDIVISSHGQPSSDATAISAIFRREEGTVYDAGKSYYEEHASNRCSNYFSDTLGGGAKWLLSAKSDSWAEAHSALGTYLTPAGNKLSWWTHAVNTSNNGTAPRFAMAANGTANVDSLYITTSLLLATTPCELIVQPAATASTSLRAEVPSDGIYRVRSYIRALNNNSNGNGVRAIVSAGGCAPSSVVVSRANNTAPFEAALAADRLWMKQGEALYFTVDPMNDPTSDATALSACYEKASDATAQVINIDIAGSGSGRRSDFTGRGREGWGTAWNALRPGAASSAIVKNCREDDGTKCNISLSITRSSGAAIATASGSTDCAMLDSAVSSSGADDAYSFTLSELVPNAAYSLYFYGTGDASFTVGGETKGLEEPWCAKEANALARFNVSADANGEISGTFYATSASGAAFGGLTIVGEFPDYEPQGMLIIFK
ncbi:MAG: hypothetical protein IKO55_17560 [Kiritimatiellae bacterium]|nr:hypothetical protein [Kiritimatiellia bacterium]